MAGAVVVAAVVAAGAGWYTSKEAAREKRRAATKALEAQRQAQDPYRKTGREALMHLEDITARGPGGPYYRWRRREEEEALEKRLRAVGMYKSGRAQQLMSGIGQRLTAEEVQAHQARLMSLTQMGRGLPVDPGPYYRAGEARAEHWGQTGQSISSVAGTWADWRDQEAQRRSWEQYQQQQSQQDSSGGG